jgi:hypothetical protein
VGEEVARKGVCPFRHLQFQKKKKKKKKKFAKLLFRYCIPMDNNRPALDLKHFGDVCPDKNGTS